MLLSPIQNSALLRQEWIQIRPRISQQFGNDFTINGKWVYKEMGMDGHGGRDYAVPVGTPIFSPMDGVVKVKDSYSRGYGLHIKIRNKTDAQEFVLGHLSKVLVVNGQKVNMGDKIALSGNTGLSTNPHTHGGWRLLKQGEGDLFSWQVLNYKNGYFGYIDYAEYEITWKGTYFRNVL